MPIDDADMRIFNAELKLRRINFNKSYQNAQRKN